MTVEVNTIKDESFNKQSEVTATVERYLLEKWSSQVGEDQLKPLFTRIANNVVLVSRET